MRLQFSTLFESQSRRAGKAYLKCLRHPHFHFLPQHHQILVMATATKFDPNFPAAAEVKGLQGDVRTAHVKSLTRLATLSIPVAGQTAKADDLQATIDEVHAHGTTISFFADLFERSYQGKLGREELDQGLIDWAMKMPGMKQKFDELPDEVRRTVEAFKDADLHQEFDPKKHGFARPETSRSTKKVAEMRTLFAEQVRADGGKGYPTVVEKDGSPVQYVNKAVFENWGQTVKNTPAVKSHRIVVMVGHVYPEERGWCSKHCQICKSARKETSCIRIQVVY